MCANDYYCSDVADDDVFVKNFSVEIATRPCATMMRQQMLGLPPLWAIWRVARGCLAVRSSCLLQMEMALWLIQQKFPISSVPHGAPGGGFGCRDSGRF